MGIQGAGEHEALLCEQGFRIRAAYGVLESAHRVRYCKQLARIGKQKMREHDAASASCIVSLQNAWYRFDWKRDAMHRKSDVA